MKSPEGLWGFHNGLPPNWMVHNGKSIEADDLRYPIYGDMSEYNLVG